MFDTAIVGSGRPSFEADALAIPGPMLLARATDTDLLVELDRRFPRLSDVRQRTCPQLCPRCSTPSKEAFGIWDRDSLRFECECGFRRTGDGYERALEDYYAECWRTQQAKQKLETAARELRRAVR